KYSSNENALKYSNAPDYFEIMKLAVKEMHRQVGDLIVNEKGIVVKGLLVRHLVLPNNLAGSEKIFEFISKEISKNTFLNIMNQYFPYYRAAEFPELNRQITQKEYSKAIKLARKFGLKRK
ncbi:radical SAM protein, partial [Candidatus Bathyarchaeota archaeon CG07_land_8_20_14_0_80_47_9]